MGTWTDDGFDCVLLDVRLPDGLGTTLLASLAVLEPRPAVVVCTAYFDDIVSLAAHFHGAIAFPKHEADTACLLRLIVGARAALSSDGRVRVAAFEEALTRVGVRAGLTASEETVLRLLVLGGEVETIACHVAVGQSHAQATVRSVLAKCGARGPTDLALTVYEATVSCGEQDILESGSSADAVSLDRKPGTERLPIDPNTGALAGPHAHVVLTPKEIELVSYLEGRPSGTHPRQVAAELFARKDDAGRGADLVYTHISNLRAKLRKAGIDPRAIEKTRKGYRIRRQ